MWNQIPKGLEFYLKGSPKFHFRICFLIILYLIPQIKIRLIMVMGLFCLNEHKEYIGMNWDPWNNIQSVFLDSYNFVSHRSWKARSDNINTVTDMKKYVPWYLECNPDRFPYWFGNIDSRNNFLINEIQRYFNHYS